MEALPNQIRYEWGYKSQCEKPKEDFVGKFFIYVPPYTLAKSKSYERGVCFPASCSKEDVLLLMTALKPSEMFNPILVQQAKIKISEPNLKLTYFILFILIH